MVHSHQNKLLPTRFGLAPDWYYAEICLSCLSFTTASDWLLTGSRLAPDWLLTDSIVVTGITMWRHIQPSCACILPFSWCKQTIFSSKMAFFSKARRERFRKRKIRRALATFALYQLECTTRKWWVHPLNEDRKEKSECYNMTLDLRKFDDRFFGRRPISSIRSLCWSLVVLVCRKSLVLSSHFLCSSLLIGSSKTDHKLLRHLTTHNYVL